MTGKVIMRIAYGADLEDPKDPYVHFAEKTVYLMNLGVSFSGLLLDLIPVCKQSSCLQLVQWQLDLPAFDSTTYAFVGSWCRPEETRCKSTSFGHQSSCYRWTLGCDGEDQGAPSSLLRTGC